MLNDLTRIIAQHDWPAQIARIEAEIAASQKAKEREFLGYCLKIAKSQARVQAERLTQR